MTETSITVGDVILRATVTGEGPTVLLLHAGGENRSVWVPIAGRVAASGLRAMAFDLRGHGESTGQATTLRVLADDVIEMVRRAPRPMAVVGASVGGLAAIAALAEPAVAHRVAGLVLVDVVPNPEPHRVRAWLAGEGLRDRHADLVADILAAGPDLHATAAALDLPILLVRAGRSPVGDADVDRFRAANRHVTVVDFPDAGHLVARDMPMELARVVAAHASVWLAAG